LKTVILSLALALSGLLSAYAQSDPPATPTYQSLSIGLGNISAYDSYLSPLKYKGKSISILGEQINATRRINQRLFAQHLVQLELAATKNPSGSAESYVGNLEYDYGLFYRWEPAPKLYLFAGLQASHFVGAVYNLRNSNNPANAKANLNLNLSAMAAYTFQIKQQAIRIRYQLDAPAVGAFFSPEFGQSYYEISLGSNSPLVYLATWHNQRTLRNLLSIEAPFNAGTLRLTLANRLYQTQINNLVTQFISNTVYLGVSKYFYTVPEKKANKKQIPLCF
jgi:hypothetical protein